MCNVDDFDLPSCLPFLSLQELAFREKYPELYARVTRRLQGLISYDLNANDEYLEAFALDSRSMKEYTRGNIQASGEDFELAQRGFLNYMKR